MEESGSARGIGDVGLICTVCHRWNDGASDFCLCRESLIGYRPLNSKQAALWVNNQLQERDAAGNHTDAADIEALREWAGRHDLSPAAADRDISREPDAAPLPPPPPPQPREGCLLTGLTVAFWFSVWMFTYFAFAMMLDYAVVDGWFHIGWAFLAMLFAGLAVALLVWRFRRVDIRLRAAVPIILVVANLALFAWA